MSDIHRPFSSVSGLVFTGFHLKDLHSPPLIGPSEWPSDHITSISLMGCASDPKKLQQILQVKSFGLMFPLSWFILNLIPVRMILVFCPTRTWVQNTLKIYIMTYNVCDHVKHHTNAYMLCFISFNKLYSSTYSRLHKYYHCFRNKFQYIYSGILSPPVGFGKNKRKKVFNIVYGCKIINACKILWEVFIFVEYWKDVNCASLSILPLIQVSWLSLLQNTSILTFQLLFQNVE